MECKKCGIHIAATANFCPNCGANIVAAKTADGKLNLEFHVSKVMEDALRTALRGRSEVGGLGFLRRIPAYIWYIFILLLCAGYYSFLIRAL